MLIVNEIFDSIQGEGSFTGYPATFVRLQGCSVQCSFCDTPYAQQFTAKHYKGEINPEELASIQESGMPYFYNVPVHALAMHLRASTKRVIFTGGEPLLQSKNLWQVIDRICDVVSIHIETSGTVPVDAHVLSIIAKRNNYITLSPKKGTIWDYYQYAHEVKMLVPASFTDPEWDPQVLDTVLYFGRDAYFRQFQPIWYSNKLSYDIALENAIQCARQYNGVISLQTHKLIGIR